MQYLTWAYIILIYAFLPLYMRNGYHELGEAKSVAYLWISAATFLLMIIVMAVKGDLKKAFYQRTTDIRSYAVAGFLLTNLLTFIWSVDKSVSFFGLSGWRMGFSTIFLMVFFLIVFSRYVKAEGYLLAAMLVAPISGRRTAPPSKPSAA